MSGYMAFHHMNCHGDSLKSLSQRTSSGAKKGAEGLCQSQINKLLEIGRIWVVSLGPTGALVLICSNKIYINFFRFGAMLPIYVYQRVNRYDSVFNIQSRTWQSFSINYNSRISNMTFPCVQCKIHKYKTLFISSWAFRRYLVFINIVSIQSLARAFRASSPRLSCPPSSLDSGNTR